MEKVVVVNNQCRKIAEIVKAFKFRDKFDNLQENYPPKLNPRFICHCRTAQ